MLKAPEVEGQLRPAVDTQAAYTVLSADGAPDDA